ncbi:MAG: hypothetical protein A2428_00095 [Bdellovibrionales bacterium RIFOXYC1_FULL_54_43]|nr:MAG: hypothetical protein A2428_00095 [Bdellovibrionales bacterium RIFOXYC1_FULL_54_43]OFZ81815.1 MAG: hypothetical protein A2603_06525 [Bdellovibrionales bacterium RIFOXYD1_FULL_55_31]
MVPVLNWREVKMAGDLLRNEAVGLYVDRIVIPERARHPEGYLKGEWVLRLTGRRAEACLLVGLRPRQPYFALIRGKGPKAAGQATRSPFDLIISKHLKGLKLTAVETLNRERVLLLWFDEMGLVLSMIPANPEALLVRALGAGKTQGWSIIAGSRAGGSGEERKIFIPPDGTGAPESPPVREELFRTPDALYRAIENEIDREIFLSRLKNGLKALKEIREQFLTRTRQSKAALEQSGSEPNWQRFGDLLKAALPSPPPIESDGARPISDFVSGEVVRVPCDRKLSPVEQVEKFYQSARRSQRRSEEARLRIDEFSKGLVKMDAALQAGAGIPERPGAPDQASWDWLGGIEKLARISTFPSGEEKKKDRRGTWSGRVFQSVDGLPILVGRNKDENLELTFKVARGNDIWMHVRGRPGAHVLIPLQPGKSAPLETLLDAAVLAIQYSGGEQWGKTEVDYTFKKFVKRIKDSTEASYTHNKTLILAPDATRLRRLSES